MPDKTLDSSKIEAINAHFVAFHDLIVNSTGIGLWDWDLVTGKVIYSSQWERIAGYEPGELVQDVSSWSNALLPEDLERAEAIIDRYLAGAGDHYEAEFRMIRKDGSVIWAQDKGTITEWDENGKPTRLIGIIQDITRLKNTEEQLKEKSDQLNVVARISGLASWDWDLRTGVILFSEDYLQMFGYARGEVHGTYAEWKKFNHPDDLCKVERALNDYIGGKTDSYSQEVRMRHKDGHYIWTLDTGRIVEWDENGRPTRIIGGYLNIDRQKQTEEELQAALRENARYNERLEAEIENVLRNLEETRRTNKTMFEANPYMNLIFNDKFQVIDCNPAAVEYFGFENREELIGNMVALIEESIPAYQPGGVRSLSLADRLHYVAKYGYLEFETLLVLHGVEIPMNIIMKRIDQKQGFSIAVYQVDLRSIKAAQREIIKQDMLLKAVNAVASILMSSTDGDFAEAVHDSLGILCQSVEADRMYVWKNYEQDNTLYCTQIYEWSKSVAPQQGKDYTTNVAYDSIMPSWRKTLLRGRIVNARITDLPEAEYRHLAPQGIRSILVIPIFMHEQFWGFIGFDDCHEERFFTEAEQGILQSAGLLIAAAMHRNKINENLIQAKEEALASARAKSNFLANMSHEIRTPMNAIIGMTTIAQNAGQDPVKIDDCLSKIDSASRHLLDIINDVLDMSKIDARKFELQIKGFSFRKMIRGVYDIHAGRAKEKRQTFAADIDNAIPDRLLGDDLRIAQVINNLLSNAVKFTPEGGTIRMQAKSLETDEEGTLIEMTVKDNGIGIPRAQQGKLFGAFEQADASISRRYEGTGLGLAISKNIVENMGGTMQMESDEGTGSCFRFSLRLQRDREAPEEPAKCRAPEEEAEQCDFTGRHILLVEDIEINRDIVASFLEGTGVEIDFAENGQAALEKFKAAPQRYDIIFMDVHMPVMDGFEATQQIRASQVEGAQTVPIVAMTANAFPEDVERCKAAGMNAHIAKPLDMDALLKITGRFLTSA